MRGCGSAALGCVFPWRLQAPSLFCEGVQLERGGGLWGLGFRPAACSEVRLVKR